MMPIGPTLCSAAARMRSGLVNWVARGQQSCVYPQLKAENHIVKRNRMSAVMRLLLGLSMGGMLFATELSARTVEEANAAIRGGNQELGLSILRELANAGDLDAMYNLGELAMWTLAPSGTPERGRSCQEMLDNISRAANRLHSASMRMLGFIYDPRETFCSTEFASLKNQRTATAWIERAARAGDIEAQIELGSRYDSGIGILKNYSEARRWYTIAAQRANNDQSNLRTEYSIIMRGSPKAQAFLAGWYLDREDRMRAYAWYNISAANGRVAANTGGYGDSDIQRDWIARLMTREQIEMAQSLARRCMESQYRNCD